MILEELAAYARERVIAAKERVPLQELQTRCAADDVPVRPPFAFEKALQQRDMAFICEIKKASPSKGVIDPAFDYLAIARDYEAAGADCISCLTEPKWFLGSDAIFREVRKTVKTPMIRKDFTVDEYQIYDAKTMGADAVLLICALLDEQTLARYLALCDTLQLSALVEAHDAAEIRMAARVGARLIGVNNRNLRDFSVDLGNAARLRALAPPDVTFVAESGMQSAQDARQMRQAGADAALVGEYLMRSADKGAALAALREAAE